MTMTSTPLATRVHDGAVPTTTRLPGPAGEPSPPSTSWRSSSSTTASTSPGPRAPCCDARACTPPTSWSGGPGRSARSTPSLRTAARRVSLPGTGATQAQGGHRGRLGGLVDGGGSRMRPPACRLPAGPDRRPAPGHRLPPVPGRHRDQRAPVPRAGRARLAAAGRVSRRDELRRVDMGTATGWSPWPGGYHSGGRITASRVPRADRISDD